MMPNFGEWIQLGTVTFAIGGIFSGLFGSGKNKNDDDGLVVEAHTFVLDALSDADKTKKIEAVTDRNWRDQITVA